MNDRHYLWQACVHCLLLIGTVVFCLPLYMALVTASHPLAHLQTLPLPFLPGRWLLHNLAVVFLQGIHLVSGPPLMHQLANSLVMALCISLGKLLISISSAYALVFYRFRGAQALFWLIFITLMLPIEVRIVPTFEVAAKLQLLDSYAGLSLPLLASATATFLFRQFFLSFPEALVDAAKLDGAGPWRFFWDIVLPLAKNHLIALFIILFVYGWNQYLWPLVVTTNPEKHTIVMGIHELANVADQIPQWNLIMAMALLAMLPPVLLIVILQRWFIQGLIETEK